MSKRFGRQSPVGDTLGGRESLRNDAELGPKMFTLLDDLTCQGHQIPSSKDSENSDSSSCQSKPYSLPTAQKWQPVRPWFTPGLSLLSTLCFCYGCLYVPHLSGP